MMHHLSTHATIFMQVFLVGSGLNAKHLAEYEPVDTTLIAADEV
jgi:hypothetical protein